MSERARPNTPRDYKPICDKNVNSIRERRTGQCDGGVCRTAFDLPEKIGLADFH
jgi:hypothetical protein